MANDNFTVISVVALCVYLNKKGIISSGMDGFKSVRIYNKKERIMGVMLDMFVMLDINKLSRFISFK